MLHAACYMRMNLNKVILIGRLTQDPEARTTPSGQNVTTIKMATNRVWSDPSGQRKDASEFHTVIAWGRLGEIASQYLKKGGLVMIEGRIQTRSWTDQANVKKYMTEIIAENLQLGPKPTGAGASGYTPSVMSDIKRAPNKVEDRDIPIIDQNEPVSRGVIEDEVSISEKDLPF